MSGAEFDGAPPAARLGGGAAGGGKRTGIGPTLARSFSGALIDLDAPEAALIDLADVARALGHIKRWNGHTARPLSVLEHSLFVMRLCPPRAMLAGAAHDGHEYMTGDGTRPYAHTQGVRLARRLAPLAVLPEALIARELAAATDGIKRDLDIAIATRLFLEVGAAPDVARTEALALAHEMRGPDVKAADEQAAAVEAVEFFGRGTFWCFPAEEPDLAALAEDWLEALRALAAERIGRVWRQGASDAGPVRQARADAALQRAERDARIARGASLDFAPTLVAMGEGETGAPVAACGDGEMPA